MLAELEAAGLVTLAEKGYQEARTRKFRTGGRTSPDARRHEPGKCKTAFTRRARTPISNPKWHCLKAWHILRKLRCYPWRVAQLAKSIHVLQIREANAG